jgi:hypothetical protein
MFIVRDGQWNIGGSLASSELRLYKSVAPPEAVCRAPLRNDLRMTNVKLSNWVAGFLVAHGAVRHVAAGMQLFFVEILGLWIESAHTCVQKRPIAVERQGTSS